MNKYFKLFIVGLENSGRSEFLKVISDFPPISVEKKIVMTERMMPLDYGRAAVHDYFFYLYSPSEMVKDELVGEMWESFSKEMSAAIILSSFDKPDFSRLRAVVNTIMIRPIHFVVVFYSNTMDSTMAISEIVKAAELPTTTPVLMCNMSEKASIERIFLEIARTADSLNLSPDQ